MQNSGQYYEKYGKSTVLQTFSPTVQYRYLCFSLLYEYEYSYSF